MPNTSVPFIAIIGGFWELSKTDPAEFERAKAMAAELGRELARAGMGLVVYFSDEMSLEPYVVTGYVAGFENSAVAKPIRVRYAESQRDDVRFREQDDHAVLFDLHLFPSDEWEAPFYRSLAEAEGVDGVLLMAGSRATLIAGQIALARKLPTLAVDSFGGSAGLIRKELATMSRDYPSAATQDPQELITWLRSKCDAVEEARATERTQAATRAKALRDAAAHVAMLTSQRRNAIWVGVSLAALIVVAAIGLSGKPSPAVYSWLMLTGLLAAGSTGALARTLLSGAQELPIRSLLLGALAGLAVGLAYAIPQWVGFPGVLDASATAVDAKDKIQLVSALLVALPAGIGFDSVFDRLRKEAEARPVAPPETKGP